MALMDWICCFSGRKSDANESPAPPAVASPSEQHLEQEEARETVPLLRYSRPVLDPPSRARSTDSNGVASRLRPGGQLLLIHERPLFEPPILDYEEYKGYGY